MNRFLTCFVIFHGFLLEVLEDVGSELPLKAVAVVPEQALQTVPAAHSQSERATPRQPMRRCGATATCSPPCRPPPPAA